MEKRAPVRSVARAIDILMALTHGPQTLGAVCEATALSKGTGHRLLFGLSHRQLVLQDPSTGMYMLGPGCFRLIDALTRGLGGLGPLARSSLTALRDATGETVTLHVRLGSQRICVEELPSPHNLRYTAGIGSTAPLHTGSAGKALLAFMPDDDLEEALESLTLEPVTERTVTDMAALRRSVEEVRRAGWAQSRGERVVGAAALSVPVRDEAGRCVAVMSVLGPESRLPADVLPPVRDQALEASAEITRRLEALAAQEETT